MKRIIRFLCLPSMDRALLTRSLLFLIAIRLGLWLLPFRIILKSVEQRSKLNKESKEVDLALIKRTIWAVTSMSRYVPRATCLTQALAANLLLRGCGQPAQIRIGVIKSAEGGLKAHAWVESQGRIVIGKLNDLSQFTVLPILKKDLL